jgi:citrate lyase subunit beta / citryl-CoA lyase
VSRSYLYAPGHDEARLETVFDHGADAVVFDLEDGVPAARRDAARDLVVAALRRRRAWVRINPAGTTDAQDDLDAVRGLAAGIRLPKTASADDARWLVERARGTPVICSIESEQGLLATSSIASVAGVATLSLGSKDLTADLACEDSWDELLFARRRLVLACRAAGKQAPVDSVYYAAADPDGLREAAEAARSLGFSGKSTLWPEHVGVINEAFQ